MSSLLTTPFSTFVAGIIFTVIVLGLILNSCARPNETKEFVDTYRSAMEKAGEQSPRDEKTSLEGFTKFLKNVGSKSYIEENTVNVYAENAYLNDTLVTHYGPKEIRKYFLATAETMTSFELTIDDVIKSGSDYYVRWTMVFSAPKIGGGAPIHSVGMSQIRFNDEGKVAFHQDFWDSGQNIYGQIPVVGGMIGIIQKRLE